MLQIVTELDGFDPRGNIKVGREREGRDGLWLLHVSGAMSVEACVYAALAAACVQGHVGGCCSCCSCSGYMCRSLINETHPIYPLHQFSRC